MNMKDIDLLSLSDIDHITSERLTARAVKLGKCWENRDMPQTLKGARIGIIEELPGWRTPRHWLLVSRKWALSQFV